jgi:hypothetical protein
MSPKQKKIAAKAPPPDKIDAKDFAVLKAEKAKGRGMGLQDEKVKPGKVMKAKTGKQIVKEFSASLKGIDESFKDKVHPMKKQRLMDRNKVIKARDGKAVKTDPTKTITDKGQFVKRRMKLTGSKLPGKIGTALGIASMMVPAAYAAAIQYKDYKSAKNRDEAKVKKMGGGMAKKYSKGGDLRAEYIHSQTKKNRKVTGEGYFTERSATRREEYGAAKDRYPNKMDRRKQMLKNLSRVLNPTMGVVKGTIDALNAPTTRKYSVGGGADMSKVKTKKKNILDKFTDKLNKAGEAYKKLGGAGLNVLRGNTKGQPFPAKKMGGGMMNKPMGYSSGTKLMDFIKSGSYTDKYGTKTNVDKAIKKINLSPKDKDLATMKPASDKKMMGGGMMQGKIYKASEGIMLSAYKRPTMSIQEGAAKARERNKKQDERKKEIDEAAKKYRVGGGGANRYGPHKVDVNRQATEALLGRGPIQEKIIKFADKFNKRIKTKKMVGGMAKKYSVGGGMMQRPMGYKHGTKPGAGPLGAAGLRQPAKENIDQIIKDQKFPPISIYIEDKKKPQKPFPVPSLYNNNKKPDKRIREGEPRAKKPSNIFGYKSGTMVKARGCKLGRTRPTKMY